MFGIPHNVDISKIEIARHAIRSGARSELEELVRFALRRHLAGSRLIYIESEYSVFVGRVTEACVAAAGEKRTIEEIVALVEDLFARDVEKRVNGLSIKD